ncbi:MAG: IS30 family transposase [Bifidobacterium sp.]
MTALRKGWTPERHRGTARRSNVRRRPAHEGQPRVPLPVDLRQAAEDPGSQAVPAQRQAAPHARQGQEVEKGPRIPMRVPIAQRPKRVDSRHEFGHFESDTVIGTAPSKRCIDTQVERKSRRLFARLIPDKSAPATAPPNTTSTRTSPRPRASTAHWDNGTESSCHLLVDEALGMLTYHADPYSSYQRGTNENRNGRIRRYLPKENQFRRPDGRGPAGHRGRDQRHPHEGPGLGNAQRGLVSRARQGTLEDKPPKDERCTYKLNSGLDDTEDVTSNGSLRPRLHSLGHFFVH